jgi:hypothetical protein
MNNTQKNPAACKIALLAGNRLLKTWAPGVDTIIIQPNSVELGVLPELIGEKVGVACEAGHAAHLNNITTVLIRPTN